MNQSISKKIAQYKETRDREILADILLQMEPLVISYAKKTYSQEFEDAKQEYYISIINACNKIRKYEHDAQCLKYIQLSVKNRYCTLCKKFYTEPVIEPIDDNLTALENPLAVAIIKNEIARYLHNMEDSKGLKRRIFFFSAYMGLSDAVISEKLGISRQYVYLLRRKMIQELKAELECA